MIAIQSGVGKGRVYNISQEETLSIEDFLGLLAETAGCELRLARVPRNLLEELSLLPACSLFSDPWMSELDNHRSKVELGMRYTPVPVYLQKLVSHYQNQPLPAPAGYQQRNLEMKVADTYP